jgi:hypothetical protein
MPDAGRQEKEDRSLRRERYSRTIVKVFLTQKEF